MARFRRWDGLSGRLLIAAVGFAAFAVIGIPTGAAAPDELGWRTFLWVVGLPVVALSASVVLSRLLLTGRVGWRLLRALVGFVVGLVVWATTIVSGLLTIGLTIDRAQSPPPGPAFAVPGAIALGIACVTLISAQRWIWRLSRGKVELPQPPVGPLARVFVCYRRKGGFHAARALLDALTRRLGAGSVLMDVESIPPGADFAAAIDAMLSRCQAVVVVIGPDWTTETDESGRRRLDDPADFVRLELEGAQHRGLLVVPALISGARLPTAAQLPASLQWLAQRQAEELHDDAGFEADCQRLADRLARALV